jgi:hypothetical protein
LGNFIFCRLIVVVTVLLAVHNAIIGQVKIGDNATLVNPNSLLELESTNKGLLMPRLALTDISSSSPLSVHIAGMIVYNTANQNDVVPGFYYSDGRKWIRLLSNGQLSTPTNIGTSPSNTLAITGLMQGNLFSDEVVTIDPSTGILTKVSLSSIVKEKQMVAVANGGQTQFQTPFPFTDIEKINVYRNGARIGVTMVNSNTIKLEDGVVCVEGDEIRITQIN